jgi:hypothetical protein
MSTKRYFFTDSDGQNKGPFVANEIAELAELGVLATDTPVVDQKGGSRTAGEIERIVRYKGNIHTMAVPTPPPLPTANSDAERDAETAPVISRRVAIGFFAVIALTKIWQYFFPDRKPPAAPKFREPFIAPGAKLLPAQPVRRTPEPARSNTPPEEETNE